MCWGHGVHKVGGGPTGPLNSGAYQQVKEALSRAVISYFMFKRNIRYSHGCVPGSRRDLKLHIASA